ncbi:MAG: SH3 domain-containing protein [Clostridia bacterium]|nr:SH3 domain-containing protein [Clostridia bacterium]
MKMVTKVLFVLVLLLFSVGAFSESYKPGDTIVFGRYEQDNDIYDGHEPISWRVLSVEGNEALLISTYALDAKPYSTKGVLASWVDSTLRTWLNETFYITAFTEEEKQRIVTKTLSNWHEPATTDTVFLLDNDQAKHLFADHADRMVKATAFAEAQKPYISREFGPDNVHWWLRTISWESDYMASFVATSGGVMTCGGESLGAIGNPKIAVRPCIWLNLDGFVEETVEPYMRPHKVLITNEVIVNVRKEPDAKASRIGTATPGKTYGLISQADNGWYEIVLEDGTTGFVSYKVAQKIE